ncbi:cation:proton antiporter [Tsukamurella sp. 8F]|uniref:cation:proton antiporter n=1 Tax=unclassified Tsukamurella TaxID=2633480 RepID=UPI0023B9ECF7|nr:MULTISPECIES: cation:proton antiporter [unclassified Tsukamurella]MDF0531189.1 cation:proton antiporter [Tsukamurella sp. 8J]MDF0585864.1 cation:proton antiporter [Tsukamurella sp. 8F]
MHSATPVPFIASGTLTTVLMQIALLLATASAMGWIARRIGLPAVVGEIIAGVVIGPSVLGQLWPAAQEWLFPSNASQQNLVDAVGQLGVVLLVGLAGAELDSAFVRRRARVVTVVGVCAFVVPLAAGVAAGFLIPASMHAEGVSTTVLALLLGTAVSVSAIPVIAKILTEMNLLHRNIGQLILAVGTTNDAVAWVLLSITSSMATVGLRSGDVAAALLASAGAIGIALFLVKPLVRPLLAKVENSESSTMYLAPLCAVIIVACAAATQALHLEAILGAFLAGMVIGPRNPRLIAPLRTVTITILAPIFLTTAGLRVDLTLLADPTVALTALSLLALAVVSKFCGAYVGARLVRQTRWEALALGAGLNTRGAVEIVIAMTGMRIGVFSPSIYTVIVLIAIATSIMAPPTLQYAMGRVAKTEEEQVRQALREP